MNTRKRSVLNVLATGLVVLILLALTLFWARLLLRRAHHRLLSNVIADVVIQPTGLFEFERPREPNLAPSAVSARMVPDAVSFAGLGIARYVQRWFQEGPNAYTYMWDREPNGDRLYYEPSLGRMVYEYTAEAPGPSQRMRMRRTLYAGPEGVAEAYNEEVGRFVSPVPSRHVMRPWVVYDRGLRRFFAIDWQARTVRSGPVLPDNDPHHPIQIGAIEKNPLCLSVIFEPPSLLKAQDSSSRAAGDGPDEQPIAIAGPLLDSDRLLVLDASGRIDLLDVETLEFAGTAGQIPAPPTLFGSAGRMGPDDVAAYFVLPVSTRDRAATGTWRYAGCAAAAISRDGTAMRLSVFGAGYMEPSLQSMPSRDTEIPRFGRTNQGNIGRIGAAPSAETAYNGFPGAPLLTVTRFTLQNLHPPALLLLSYFTASSLEATAGGRSIFLLPDSFVAMKARHRNSGRIDRFFSALFFMLPAIVLAVVLAWRAGRDAARTGLSANARSLWIIGTILLGLPAYLTYRLTRPAATLVTCQSCGLGRRPDTEKCHRCGSVWTVPELTPPAWRVLGEDEQAEEASPSQAEEMGSPAQ